MSTREAGHPGTAVKSSAPRELHFRDETVAQAAQAFNRYNRRKIVIDDAAIANLTVGGIFEATESGELRGSVTDHEGHPVEDGRAGGPPNDPVERGGTGVLTAAPPDGSSAAVKDHE